MEHIHHYTSLLLQWPPPDWATLHFQLCVLMIVSGLGAFIALLCLTAPYGRYSRPGWGPMINARLAWLTQEIPSLLVTGYICWTAGGVESYTRHPTSLRTAITGLFLAHYIYRSLVYPFRIRADRHMPLSVWVISFVFCVWNGFVQGYFLGYQLSPSKPITPLSAVGLAVQAFGLCNVILCDHILVTLRKPGQTGYLIPRGGMFELVSAGNYCSEIIEWTGYALAGQALAPASFAWFTFANLAPRGVQHHLFYKQKFEDYPPSRKAVIPFVW